MDARRRLFPYLLLNIFVSALVTGSMIYFYDRAHKSECLQATQDINAVTSDSSVEVNVVGVIGAGTLADERVVIQNNGSTKLVLSGWYLKDKLGDVYTFPQSPTLTLYPGASMQVHTGPGIDSLPDLYWGRSSAVWTSGELVALYDPQNIARALYRVP